MLFSRLAADAFLQRDSQVIEIHVIREQAGGEGSLSQGCLLEVSLQTLSTLLLRIRNETHAMPNLNSGRFLFVSLKM